MDARIGGHWLSRPEQLRNGSDMSRPTFNDVRRQFGTGLALAWLVMLWRLGLLRAGVRSYRDRTRYMRRRSPDRASGVAEWVVLAVVGSVWILWAFLMVKGVIAYVHRGY
jgi:hypothetical protein